MNHYKRQAAIARTLAHPVRLQILEALALQPACVCDLVALTRHRQPYVSQQLAVLRRAGLVKAERVGLQMRYRLARSELEKSLKIIRSISLSNSRDWEIRKTQRGEQMSDNKNGAWHGVPRAEINWNPIVVPDRCIGCGLCVTSCGRGVYAFNYEENKPVVAAPELCMVGCTTCATTCPEDAIDFPSRGYIRQLIKQKKILRQSKDMLRANREKYDVAQRQKAAG
jgi:DNA-binding transcriptional ArsR family regulator/NAD-dependent dihydropyrimidine dehydrogenase PreA subunit